MTLGTTPRFWFAMMLVALACITLNTTTALAQESYEGSWVAKVPGPQGEIEFTLNLTKSEYEVWSGTLKGAQRTVDLEKLVVNGTALSFSVPNPEMGITAVFAGTFDGNRLQGSMKAGEFPAQELNFIRQVDTIVSEDGGKKYRVGSGPAGVWTGRVRAPDGEDSHVILKLDKEGSDWLASIEDPFVDAVSGESVKVTETMISFTFRPEGAPFPSHFSGTYIAAEDRVTGSFSQRGTSRFVKFERDPSTVTLGLGPDGEPIQPPRVRHAYKFGLTGRLSYWPSLHLVKDETYNINTLTKGALNYDLGLKFFVLDGFNVFARAFRGGQGMTDDAVKLADFEDIGLTSESYLKLDGYEFGVMGYLGNVVAPNSAFNPYLTAAVGHASWELTDTGRGSTVLSLDDEAFTGSDFCAAFGLGTEYELNENMCLEFEFLWRYFMTEDTEKWTDNDNIWSNTHAWSLSAGLTYGFF